MNRYEQRIQELGGEALHQLVIHVPEERLQEVEQQLQATLPPDYREFIRDYGNFAFEAALFPIKPNDEHLEHGMMDIFHAISVEGKRDVADLVQCYNGIFDIETWPQEWMPIAGGGGPYAVVLCIKGEKKGVVGFFVNDLRPDGTPKIHPVADSFDEFMQLIYLDV